jgi:putative tricarboxylic transport membrane protein
MKAFGPRVFPTLVGIGLSVAGAAFVVDAWRRSAAMATSPERRAPIAWITGGLALATALLAWTGFPPAVALLFAMTARGFDARRWPRNLLIGLILGLAIYVAFARGLGVSLPGGPLERF